MNNENQTSQGNRQPEFTEKERVAMITALHGFRSVKAQTDNTPFTPEFFRILDRAIEKLASLGTLDKPFGDYRDIFLKEGDLVVPAKAEMKIADLKTIQEDDKEIISLGYFKDKPVRFRADKATGEMHVNADDVAKAMGYESSDEMMSSDEGLDAFLEYQKENPSQPPLKSFDSGAVDQNSASLNRDWWKKDFTVTFSPRERGTITDIILKYKNIMIDGFEMEEKDYEEVTPTTETDLWAVFAKLNPQNYDKPA